MNNNRVSILVPVRNEGQYIERCLNSLVQQTWPHEQLEIWVIDGMSTDTTRTIILDFCARYPFISLLDNPEQTAPFAMNYGLARAQGDILIRVDGHCEIASDYVAQCLETLQATGADCVGGPLKNQGETFMAQAIALAMSSPFGVGNAKFRYSQKAGYVDTLAFGAYRREAFSSIGAFDPELTRNQDDEFNYRLRASGKTIYLNPAIRSIYYTRGNLKSLWHQYFQYGFWKIKVIRKHPGSVMLRHLVPGVLVAALVLSSLLALTQSWGHYALKAVVLPYGLGIILATIYQSRQHLSYFPLLLLIFPTLHLAYGCGFWWGVLSMTDSRTS